MNPFYKLNEKLAAIAAKSEKESLVESARVEAVAQSPFTQALNESAVADKDYDGDGRVESPKDEVWGSRAKAAAKSGHAFGEKISGAKKEVDEMLGDVAAHAMKNAVKGIGTDISDKAEKMRIAKGKPAGALKNVGKGLKAFFKGEEEPMDEEGIPSSSGGEIHKTATGLRHVAGKRYSAMDVDSDDSDASDSPKKKGRPTGIKTKIGAKGPGIKSKLLQKAAIKEEGHKCPHCGHSLDADLDEEKTETKDSRAERAGKKVTKDLEYDMKHKGKDDDKAERAGKKVTKDIEYDDKKSKKTEGAKVDRFVKHVEKSEEKAGKGKKEAESIAWATANKKGMLDNANKKKVKEAESEPKTSSKGGYSFGQGVYESINSKYESLLEGFEVEMSKSLNDQGVNDSQITVRATGVEADRLKDLLKMAGIDIHQHSSNDEVCPECGQEPCACDAMDDAGLGGIQVVDVVDENSLDWPTDSETLAADPNLRTYSGGLNGPKSTGQTTIPVIANQGRQATMEENTNLERSLFKTWKNYKG